MLKKDLQIKEEMQKEYKFIDFALNKMEKGGYLFAITPNSIMTSSRKCLTWRKKMLENNTLKAVIRLPDDLFYPVSVCTVGIVLQKGISQDKNKSTFL